VRRAIVLIAVTTLAIGTGVVATTSRAANTHSVCGVERWTVKTLQDRPVLRPTRGVTLRYLVTRPHPGNLGDARIPFERRRFTVTAAVTLVRHEGDDDFHLVLEAGGVHMIAEAPLATCTNLALPAYRKAMATARSQVRLCARARITGVAFFDFDHGQTGVAPNAIELHPILGFRCLSP
jgi:hypothetical protein